MKQLKDTLPKRQEALVSLIQQSHKPSTQALLIEMANRFDTSSRITVIRDLNALLKKKYIKRNGKGRGVWYESLISPLLRPINAPAYFQEETDLRIIQKSKIHFTKKDTGWNSIFSKRELQKIHHFNEIYKKRLGHYSKKSLQKELERITIEFAWKSSRIEGNTYSLLDTERLIKLHEEARGHSHEEALMVLNHKTALDYVLSGPSRFRKISVKKIEELHDLLVKGMGIKTGIRKHPVRITGTAYIPYDNQYQIRENLEKLCELLNSMNDPFLKTIIGIVGLSYIQPFEDGNKRCSRILGNAFLLAYGCCPLSYRSVDEVEYKKAMILFYEQHSIFNFKKIFVDQFEFAVKNYFL